jgi:hypothetical protein
MLPYRDSLYLRTGRDERRLIEPDGLQSISFPKKPASFPFPIDLSFLKDGTDQ